MNSLIPDPLLQIIEEGHKRELVQQKMISDEMFQKELKSAYSRGYGEAQADIFAAIKKEPEKYHEFISWVREKHRAETTANSEKKFDMEWHPTGSSGGIAPNMVLACVVLMMGAYLLWVGEYGAAMSSVGCAGALFIKSTWMT